MKPDLKKKKKKWYTKNYLRIVTTGFITNILSVAQVGQKMYFSDWIFTCLTGYPINYPDSGSLMCTTVVS